MKTFYLRAGKPAFAVAVAAALMLTGCEKEAILEEATTSNSSDARALEQHQHVPNELLVKFKAGVAQEARNTALARINGRVKERVLTKAMDTFGDKEGFLVVITPLAVFEAINKMRGGAEIEYAEPNYIYQHSASYNSNDTYYTNGSLWGMYGSTTTPKNDFGSQAGAAWAGGKIGSPTVYIGIIDEGVMYNHEDLVANMQGNLAELNGVSGVDDDGNGYIDDVYGWDFDGNNNTIYDGTHDDHGTHVAGTIGAKGGNGKGVAGVCWNVQMLNAKFLGRNGGTTANAIKAVDYFTELKTRSNNPVNIVATNNSWGGGGFSQALLDAITRGANANILFIAAAGNGGRDGVGDNNDETANYPSNYDTSTNKNIKCTYDAVIAVAALTSSGAKATYSNYGALSVDLGAPGSGIYSTLPGRGNKSAYGSYSGTSMATPHVTGAAALYAASNLNASATNIKSAILSSATATASMSGISVTGGRLNVSGF